MQFAYNIYEVIIRQKNYSVVNRAGESLPQLSIKLHDNIDSLAIILSLNSQTIYIYVH